MLSTAVTQPCLQYTCAELACDVVLRGNTCSLSLLNRGCARAVSVLLAGKLYAGPEVDVWSCGVILYALLCGSLPFDDENIPNLFKKIKNGVYVLPTHLSPGARHLISRMLLVDPLKRITIPEIRQHPWFLVLLPRYLAVMQVRLRCSDDLSACCSARRWLRSHTESRACCLPSWLLDVLKVYRTRTSM